MIQPEGVPVIKNPRYFAMLLRSSVLTTLLCGYLLAAAISSWCKAIGTPDPSRNNVVWDSLGSSELDSMPIGNGDLAANVWTEQNGDLVLLVAKSDAWSELNKLDKIARIRVRLTDNPFAGTGGFTQTLHLENGSVEIRSGGNRLLIWVDANRPVLHIQGDFAQPVAVEARLELWRNRVHPYNQPSPDRGGLFGLGNHPLPMDWAADTVLPASSHRLTWYHLNPTSIFPIVLEQQHLESLQTKYPDPLLNRCFGATLVGAGMIGIDNRTLRSTGKLKKLSVDLVALTTTAPDTVATWQQKLDVLIRSSKATSPQLAWKQHQAWWNAFWNRSWIQLDGPQETRAVEQGYAIQRYMMAASSRGAYPAKFNGGLFTVGHDLPDDVDSNEKEHSPDYRRWGGSYWNQNNRLLYWPLLATGDFDLIKPWFDMYLQALPLAKDRTHAYYHHDGAAFIETMDFWGLPNLNDYGWDHQSIEVESHYMRYHIQGGIEVVAQMLDQYDLTQDAEFARDKMLPFANAILTFYEQHWPSDENGKLLLSPSQSIETYQLDAVNPTPDIAGLHSVVERLLQLPIGVVSDRQREAWKRLREKLPSIATGTTFHSKIPPHGQGESDGIQVLLPARSYGGTKNSENPELYAVFPYRIYGVGKKDLTLARDTFTARLFPRDTCWGQDGEDAALLGLTAESQKAVLDEFTEYGDQRFKWFWRSASDWIPDLDNGGAGMMTLQLMLLQSDGRRIQLLPAWPSHWTADFKLHAPYRTTVQGHVENGRITHLVVTPEARRKDLVIPGTSQ